MDPKKPNNDLLQLPSNFDYTDKQILQAAMDANAALAKLNGLAMLLPNADILMAPLLVKESVESNAIENINTTTVKVLQAEALNKSIKASGPEKEVLYYRKALLYGIEKMKEYEGISANLLVDVQHILEPHKEGIRSLPGTIIGNNHGETLYTPPEGEEIIRSLLSNLEKFINTNNDNIDPLIKVGVIHYQFESIHPFYDGNGRAGRMLMMLYLILTQKLEYPVLFLSEYINKTRSAYYKLLNQTNHTDDYKQFILYTLEGIRTQSLSSQQKIISIKYLMDKVESVIRDNTKFDYHHIAKVLFSHPYLALTDFAVKLNVTRQTASRYLSTLEKIGVMKSIKIGRNILLYMPEFITLLS